MEQIDSFSEKHAVTPSNDPDQSTYTCRAHADERPLYSKSSDSFKTKNLRKYNWALLVMNLHSK